MFFYLYTTLIFQFWNNELIFLSNNSKINKYIENNLISLLRRIKKTEMKYNR